MEEHPRSYYETHRAIEAAETADEVRKIVASFVPSEPTDADERQLMISTIIALCRCNNTDWRTEVLN